MAGFTGGDKLQALLGDIGKKVEGAHVEVGFLENATYPDGTSVAMVAAVQNFGSPRKGIPARPFFTNMIIEKSGEWPSHIYEILKASGFDSKRTLGLLGEGIKGQLQESIQQFNSVPLAKATVEKKGFDKQLIDTSVMINSVDFRVKDGAEN